jgi:hypothetical protein
MMTLTSAPVSVVTVTVLPVIDLIVPTALTLDFAAVVGWVPSFCATAKSAGVANRVLQTTKTNTFRVAMGLRFEIMPDTSPQSQPKHTRGSTVVKKT